MTALSNCFFSKPDGLGRGILQVSLTCLKNCIIPFYNRKKLFHCKSFAIVKGTAKNAKVFHHEHFAIYSIHDTRMHTQTHGEAHMHTHR